MDQGTSEKKARINAIWEQLNAKSTATASKSSAKAAASKLDSKNVSKQGEPSNKVNSNATPEWMVSLGLAHSKPSATVKPTKDNRQIEEGEAKEDSRKIAAAALAAAKEASLSTQEGKIAVSEILDFAGEEVKVTKFLDPNSKAAEALKRKQEMMAWSSSSLDKLIQQIDKKPKLNVLEKSRKDWKDFKEDKQLEEELDSHIKSGDKYTERVAFLRRSDLREYEQERDARLALQAKRPTDTSYAEDL